MSLLVLGASGFIGSAFLRTGSASDIFTSSRSGVPGCVPFDALRDNLMSIDGLQRISHALILFAEREPDACFSKPRESATLNVEAALNVIAQCVSYGIVPMFASTELVFDGLSGNYPETSPPQPILEYGRQKLEVERKLSAMTQDYLVLRFPKTVGTRLGDRSLFTGWIQEISHSPESMRCAYDQRFSIQHVEDVPAIVTSLIRQNTKGIVHLGDGQSHSRLDLLELLCSKLQMMGRATPRIKVVSIDDMPFLENRPHDVSLDTSKLQSLTGYEAPPITRVIDDAILRCVLGR
ncbi:MAG: dTDP-4-dehydrorhamnose reductase [Actinomycetota bacterium]|jgi:dTDP-4-dehydrorhamnose reductase